MELPFELEEKNHKTINKTYTVTDKCCREIASWKGRLGMTVREGRDEI